MGLLKNTASQVVTFALVNATDGSALTGATVTTKVTKDGTQAASAGTLTELGSGQYKYVPTQSETNATSVGLLFTATNAVPVNLHMFTDDYAAREAAVADAVWDEALAGHATAGSAGKKLSDISAATPLDAAGVRTAVGLASANLDTQLADLPTAAENADANWDEARSGHVAAGSFGEGVKVDSIADAAITADSIDYGAIQDDKIHNATYTEMGAKAAQLTWQSLSADYAPAGGFYVADSMGEQMTHLDADVSSAGGGLDAAGVRSAIGLASANLDTQLGTIDDFLDTEVAAIKAKTDLIPASPASTTNITAASGIAVSSIGANVITATSIQANAITSAKIATDAIGAAQLAADAVAEIVDANWDEALVGHAAVGSAGERLDNLYTLYLAGGSDGTVIASNFVAAPDAAGIRSAVGLASANLDTQLGAIDDYLDTEVAAIKAKTDNLPAAPAAVGDIPSAATVASQVRAELTTELGRIDVATSTRLATAGYTAPLDAAGTRTAVGLATANLDTQLTAIDDLVDTEIGAIKAKTDLIPASPAAVGSAMTLADEAITDAKIAELAFRGKHFDTDVEISAVTGAVGSVTAGVTVTTNNDKTGYTLTSGERNSVADALLDRADAIATGITLREAVEVAVAALAGKLSGVGTATITIRDIADTKNVIVATVSAGNRTAVTITP